MMTSSNGNIFFHRLPVNSPHKGQWRGALVFSLICAWINGWVNNHEAGYLRRHRPHYDVIVMATISMDDDWIRRCDFAINFLGFIRELLFEVAIWFLLIQSRDLTWYLRLCTECWWKYVKNLLLWWLILWWWTITNMERSCARIVMCKHIIDNIKTQTYRDNK